MAGLDERRTRRERRRLQRARRRRLALAVAGLALVACATAIGVVHAFDDGSSSSSTPTVPLTTPTEATDAAQPLPPEQETTTPATRPRTPVALEHVRGKTVAIDPGHNGLNYLHGEEINRQVDAGTLWKACDTTGTQTDAGYTEASFNLDVALRLTKILRRAGARVVLTRMDNEGWGPCITERAAIGNRAGADVAISIHADGGPDSGRGFHVNYPPAIEGLTDDIATDSRRLALAIRDEFRTTGMPDATYIGQDGLNVRSDFGGLNLSDVPKVLFETGNMRNSEDVALLTSAGWRQRAAAAIARGLNAYLGG